MLLEDIEAYLVANGVGAAGTVIFGTPKARIPDGDGPYVSLVSTGGYGLQFTQSTQYGLPTLQITVRARDSSAARLKAKEVFDLLANVRNVTIGSQRYLWIKATQSEPADQLPDSRERARVTFNITTMSTPA